MQETKPLLLLKKYRSILTAATIVELVTFLVSLTDTIVAANVVGMDALAAVGLVAPFFSIATFVTAVINSGTVTNYSERIGHFDPNGAHGIFGQGVIMAVSSGILLTVILLLIKNIFIDSSHISGMTRTYLEEYYDIIVFYFMMAPISALLDNIVVSDGGEKLSAISNSIQIVGNVVLSILLSMAFGIRGIAIATVSCKALFIVLICLWFFSKKNTIHFRWHFSTGDGVSIVRRGLVRATTFAMTALMMMVLNADILKHFDTMTFDVWVIIQKVLGLSSIFLGLSMTLQPLIGTLRGEKNTKAIRILTRHASFDMLIAGGITAVPILCFAPTILRVFDMEKGEVFDLGKGALHITGLMMIFMALTVFLFIYYFLIDKQLLAVTVSVLKDLVCPLGRVLLLETIWKGQSSAIWVGLTIAAVITLLFIIIIVLVRYGKELFPYLIPREPDSRIYIYAFDVTDENIIALSKTAQQLLQEHGFSQRTQYITSLCLEDLFMLIKEKNREHGERLFAECTLIMEEEGARLILRDTGIIFDITDEDAAVDSFLQYTVANMMQAIDYKAYVVTTGYNRNELFFEERKSA